MLKNNLIAFSLIFLLVSVSLTNAGLSNFLSLFISNLEEQILNQIPTIRSVNFTCSNATKVCNGCVPVKINELNLNERG